MPSLFIINPYTTLGGGSVVQRGLFRILSSFSSEYEICKIDFTNSFFKNVVLILEVINKLKRDRKSICIVQGLFELPYLLFDLFPCSNNQLIVIPRGAYVPNLSERHKASNVFLKNFFWILFIKRRMLKVRFWICASKLERYRFIDRLDFKNCRIIPDFFDGDERFNEISTEKVSLSFEKYLLYVGRFSPEKNLSFLVHLMQVIRKTKNLGLVLAAPIYNQSYYNEIIKLIDSCELEDLISVKTRLSHAELQYLYKNSELVLLPSFSESFGLTVLESLYFNKPVLISDNVPFDFPSVSLGNKLKLNIDIWADRVEHFIGKGIDRDVKNDFLMKYKFDRIRSLWQEILV